MPAQNLIPNSENVSAWGILTNVAAALALAVAGPDGALGGVSLVTANGGGGALNHFAEMANAQMPYFAQGLGSAAFQLNAGRERVSGAWIKAGTTTKVVVGNGRHTNWYRALFNLSNGTVDTEENCRAYIEPGENGWYYCCVVYIVQPLEANVQQDSVVVAPVPAAQTGTASIAYNHASESCYAFGATLALTNGPPPYQKTTTQTNEARAPRARNTRQNNIRWSENPSNAVWTKYAASCAASAVNSPLGGLAEAIIEDGTLGFHGVSQGGTADKGIYTITALVKAGTRSWCLLATAGTGVGAYFDLTLGVTGSIFGSPLAASIEPAGDGWWWISVTHAIPAAIRALELYAATGNAAANYTGTNGNTALYVAGMSLAQSWGPPDHVKTTVAVINPKIGVRGRARQNLTPASEDFTAGFAWFKESGAITVTADVVAGPDGALTKADRIQWTSGILRYVGQNINFTRGPYTVSVWLRSATGGTQLVRLRLPLIPGTSNQDSPVLTLTPDWQRFSFSVEIQSSNVTLSTVLIESDAGLSAADFYAWGFQLTQTARETQYVKSTTQAVLGRAPRSLMGKQNLLLSSQGMHSDAVNWFPTLVTRSASPALAPDGTATVSRIEDTDPANYGYIRQQISIPPGVRSYCFSIYLRKTATSAVCGWNYLAVGGTTQPGSMRVAPATGAWSSGGTPGGVEDCGDYWRVWNVVRNQGSSALRVDFYVATGTSFNGGDNAAGVGWVDVWGAQWTEGEGPTEYVATTTAVVNTGAPRRRAPRQNVGANSDMLSGAWSIANATRSAGPAGPTGKTGILVLEDGSAAAVHYITQTVTSLGTGRLATLTFYAKRATAGSRQWIACAGNGGNSALWFDLINFKRGTGGGGCVASTIEQVEGGYAKISISWIQTAGLEGVRIYMADADGSVTFNGDSGASGGIYVFEAQVTEGYGPPPEQVSTRNTPVGSQAQEYDRGPRGLYA